MASAETLHDLIAPIVSTLGFELVRIRLTGSAHKTLQVMAERPDGTDECRRLRRTLARHLGHAGREGSDLRGLRP